jgi:ArsR family transcriptional regulator, arsenate/arsenite/antimonite-responsive transcriptional repressor
MESSTVIKALAALAHASRLTAFRALVVAGPRGLTPSTMANALNMPASSLSFHLKELLNAGLVAPSRDGRFLVYRANFETMNAMLGYLTQNCCEGAACSPNLRGSKLAGSQRQCTTEKPDC